jgi:parallel beta-helix repeat protein
LFYTGISVGWRWGYGESLAKNNLIALNHIHDLGQGALSDLGGIYTLGPSDGTRISRNHIHNLSPYDKYGRGGWGIYNDEGSSQVTIENNLVHDVKDGGYHQNSGRENLIRNNIFAFSVEGQLQRSAAEAHLSFTFTNNIVYWNGGPLLSGNWTDGQVKLDRNLYWDASGQPVRFAGMTLDQWRSRGHDAGSVIADPLFVNATGRDFRLRPGSPAPRLGFQPFDYSQAGVYGSDRWKNLARGRR